MKKIYRNHTIRILTLFSHFSFQCVLFAEVYEKTNWKEPRSSKIIFVENTHQERFVIKKHADAERAIHEAIGAIILKSLGINAPFIKIIPAGDESIQEFFLGPATLQKVVPGKEIGLIPEYRFTVNIALAITQKTHLKSIGEYNDLAPLVAANIFLNDPDGNNRNIFYDMDSKQFHVIDKELSFCDLYLVTNDSSVLFDGRAVFSLAAQSRIFLQTMQQEDLSDEEQKALVIVNDTLKTCLNSYPPHRLVALWLQIAKQANYIYSPSKQNYMKDLFEYYHNELKLLCKELDRLASNL